MSGIRVWFSLFALVGALTGCSSPQTRCPIEDESGYCASPETVYKAALRDGGNDQNVLGKVSTEWDEDEPTQPKNKKPSQSVSAIYGFVEPPDAGGPVFVPPVTHRMWIAPWHDENNILHSGEYLYYITPGYWRYGTLAAPGDGAEILGPIAPDDFGFNPMVEPEESDQIGNPRMTEDGVIKPVVNYSVEMPKEMQQNPETP